jgi:NitT/TauT family transport system permease protein
MISTTKNDRVRAACGKVFSAAFWLCVWQLAYFTVGQEILIVSPVQVLSRLFELVREGDFWLTVLFSMLRVTEGFLIGVFAGTVLAVLSFAGDVLFDLIRPVVSVVKATPVASFIILALVWMKSPHVPVFASVLVVTPIVFENVREGIRKTDRNLLQMARSFRFGAARTARHVYLPSVTPYFTAACATAMGMAWKGGIAAEVLSSIPLSIGGRIYEAKIYIDTAGLFSWTAVVIVMSVLLEKLLIRAMRKAGRGFGAVS